MPPPVDGGIVFIINQVKLNDVQRLYKERTNERQDQGQVFPMCSNSKNKRSSRC
jgi:hypothetical protein